MRAFETVRPGRTESDYQPRAARGVSAQHYMLNAMRTDYERGCDVRLPFLHGSIRRV